MWLFHTDCSLLYEGGHHVVRRKQMSVEFFGILSWGCYHLSVRPWVSRITLWAPKFFSQQWEVQATFLISFGSVVKNPPANAGDRGDVGLIPGLIRSPAGGNDNPTPVFLPGKFHGQGSLVCYIIHGVAKSQAWWSAHTYTHTEEPKLEQPKDMFHVTFHCQFFYTSHWFLKIDCIVVLKKRRKCVMCFQFL